ncbi:sigma 54-interacting transcriptional regulator [Crenobacter sp. SG2305]|uniref:sigma 54-interacting transcriptional regulator n=1 Tax=Crenobacter oryzisoli TaxID=3056844 RepID=UPI0025AA85F9|nr:sigma 54-interacting transcriptional regulator [Crenobacter sp. SG2305]MDN0082215.1 sigma 54-interacting transcriptional regulator [Crenobacter sp. SG2305]
MNSSNARILLVDDDPDLLHLTRLRLASVGWQVDTAASGEAALSALAAHRADVLVTDWQMPKMDGMALFDEVRRRYPALPVIIITAHGTVPDAVEAVSRGVFGYLVKPFEGSELLAKVKQALSLSAVAPVSDDGEGAWRKGVISRSPQMEELLAEARLVAATDASVLISGESGTGKEVLAQAIHRASSRSNGPFVAVNCGAIPENLLESELFGHEKGAFTGAASRHNGLFLEADGGTLFLDEIGDMPLPLQVKLLRVLQEREIRPVGSARSVPVNVRVVSATHRDLEGKIREGVFREDLYYRLNVVALKLPTLAERREDIPLLARHFLERVASRYGKDVSGFSQDALEALMTASWRGNVRQLANVVEQCCVLATSPVIPLALVQKAISEDTVSLPSLAEARRQFEHDYLSRLLRLTGGNVADAARIADRNRTEFYRLLQKYELTPTAFKVVN